MKKLNIESNEKAVQDFINELKKDPLLEGYEITSWNANDFYIFAEEHRNCANCRGLSACKNTNLGYALEVEKDSFVLTPCRYKLAAKKQELESQKIKTLFIPKNILQADLSQFETTTENRKKIFEYIVKFIQNTKKNVFTKGLYIHGNFSTGKTFILGCIANELARNDIDSLIIYFPDLVVELKSSIGSPRLEELINYLKSVDVLLLDDFGSENMSSWLRDEILGPVLNYRLMEEKPIFISSNLNPVDELKEQLAITKTAGDSLKAERIISRLNGLVQTIELDNSSYKR